MTGALLVALAGFVIAVLGLRLMFAASGGWRAHLAYLRYVLRHKWYVFVGCRKVGVGLWQSLIHDWTKFLPVEWGPYVRNFYQRDGSPRAQNPSPGMPLADGTLLPWPTEIPYQRAWLHHQRQPHHWQAWVVQLDSGFRMALPMPWHYVREMVADWYGAGRAIMGRHNPRPWYGANQDRMILHPRTRATVEALLREHWPTHLEKMALQDGAWTPFSSQTHLTFDGSTDDVPATDTVIEAP